MGLFGLFAKKEKKLDLELPPPPLPSLDQDIPPIKPGEFPPLPQSPLPEFPPLPEPPHDEQYIPPAPVARTPAPVQDKTLAPVEAVRVPSAQLFVSVDDYRKVMQHTNVIRTKLIETEAAVRRLSELRQEEERALDKWSKELEDVERKLARVDHAIAKAQI